MKNKNTLQLRNSENHIKMNKVWDFLLIKRSKS